MNYETAKRISDLVLEREKLLFDGKLLIKQSGDVSNELEFQVKFRVRSGLYSGYPLDFPVFDHNELARFLGSKITQRIQEIDNEINSYESI